MLHLYFNFTYIFKDRILISDNERPVPLRLAQPVWAGAYKMGINLAPTGTGINIRFIYLQDLNPGFKT